MRVTKVLNGVWEFVFKEEKVDASNLDKVDFSGTMPVPGCFDVMHPQVGLRGWGCYRKQVTTGGMVKLFIDGLGVEGEVFWDGKPIGVCKYAYMPEGFYFDAGAYGEHELVIVVCNKHNEIFFPFYDFYAYGGIYGSVTLYELPKVYLDRFQIKTLDYRSGLMEVEVFAPRFIRKEYDIAVQVDAQEPFKFKFSGKSCKYQFKIKEFKLWSPESPNLHHLTVTMGNDQLEDDFGVRQIWTEGEKIMLNGERIFLMGYNRHDSHVQFGAAVPPSLMAADLQLIKSQGCNFVRGSHYPQREEFLKLCDRIGILFWEETLGWDVKPPTLLSREFLKNQLIQAEKLPKLHFNHPSIIIWGFMNETESQMKEVRPIIDKVIKVYRKADSGRLITYASNKYEKDICMDLVDIVAMNPYPGWGDVNWERVHDICNVVPRFEKLIAAVPADKPYMISETGGSGIYGFRDPFRARWSEEYQADLLTEICRVALNNPRYSGLCIWHFSDAKTYINGFVMGRPRGFNDKAVTDEYRRPKLAWDAVTRAIENSEYGKKRKK